MVKSPEKRTKNIFSLARLKFQELWDDASEAVKKSYNERGQAYSEASPFFQILRVILHMSKMIFYYIEDSITELNILTANRPTSIRGLSTLTGHDPFRGSCAKGIIDISFNPNADLSRYKSVTIRNMTKLTSSITGLSYLIIVPGEAATIPLDTESVLSLPVYQGSVEFQTATGTGEKMQSFNFPLNNSQFVDHFLSELYVDGVKWRKVESLYDMGYWDRSYILRSGLDGGIDIFFGDGDNGAIPRAGSTILLEYISHFGVMGNLRKTTSNALDSWKFMSPGYSDTGEKLNLDDILRVKLKEDITLGADPENTVLTRLAAPQVSRSMVLANEVNYEYFLRRLNMFSIIDVIKGNNTFEDQQNRQKYDNYRQYYYSIKQEYLAAVNKYGEKSDIAKTIYADLTDILNKMRASEQILRNSTIDDNVIYLFLIPDIRNRLEGADNYFTCPIDSFSLSESEQRSIINLIEQSGEKILTVDNRILKPLFPKFAINIDIHKWDGVSETTIYESIIKALSNYFIENTRRDRIPRSDLIKIIENIDGVDSVNVTFDSDKNNINIFKSHDGIDKQNGDVILYRTISNNIGDKLLIRDAYPLFRGGFESINGIYYSDVQQMNNRSAVNINFIGTSFKSGTNVYSGNEYRSINGLL